MLIIKLRLWRKFDRIMTNDISGLLHLDMYVIRMRKADLGALPELLPGLHVLKMASNKRRGGGPGTGKPVRRRGGNRPSSAPAQRAPGRFSHSTVRLPPASGAPSPDRAEHGPYRAA